MDIPVLSRWHSKRPPEVLVWVGCAGAFDSRYKKVIQVFVQLLKLAKVSFAILGEEETCTGDPAKRMGNEYLFQIQALNNIKSIKKYGIQKIVASCPHCFNTLKNEYPSLGGKYKVFHHSQYLQHLIKTKRLLISPEKKDSTPVVYHDSCYLGRGNQEYEAPRYLLKSFSKSLKEMRRAKSKGLCCGAGGGQMFKEPEKGHSDIQTERIQEAIQTGAKTISTGCPFCMTMLEDGLKHKEEKNIKVKDLAEWVWENLPQNPNVKV
ncbi:MAG: (Fe-S)-binding protein [Cytophagales bacterium]|nr:(Fe-S)-binding protein [Cytophagales bacterium]